MDETERELAHEQGVVDRAYAALRQMQEFADRRRTKALDSEAQGLDRNVTRRDDGSFYARFQRDAFLSEALARQAELEIGDHSLVFGRSDPLDGDPHYVGRLGVLDETHNVLVSDWRAPASESFYRATPREPLGLRRRRHLHCLGPQVVDYDDEHFTGDEADGSSGLASGALLKMLERERTGEMRDIVATIQREQDEIIRHAIDDVLVVQGPPGTGKTVVALHRAAYLLFTHREKLERDGLLIVGPSQVFLRYIQHVLPALGESGAALTTIPGMFPSGRVTVMESQAAARVKGDPRMVDVVKRAVRERQRGSDRDVAIDIDGRTTVRLTQKKTWRVAETMRRRRGTHNGRRRGFERELLKGIEVEGMTTQELAKHPDVQRHLDRMWPRLTPQELLRPLFASEAALAVAAKALTADERALLLREPAGEADTGWTRADVPVLEEALRFLGPVDGPDDLRRYGHVIVDEAQTLSPMDLRMIARRGRASFTLTGDLAQSMSAWNYERWEQVLEQLGVDGTIRTLSVNYRGPVEVDAVANRVRAVVAPKAEPARAVRETGRLPSVERCDDVIEAAGRWAHELRERRPRGTVAVIAGPDHADAVAASLPDATDTRTGQQIKPGLNIVAWRDVSGLEFDGAVVIEPAGLVDDDDDLHHLYVVLTRPTQDLAIVHATDLPGALADAVSDGLFDVRS